ncbi:hypothetical protein CLOM_g8367 [Closterium sp. NIES-68]|nr:hypothetical protein CLOM_g8367 [Closterium sp. NIES-68]
MSPRIPDSSDLSRADSKGCSQDPFSRLPDELVIDILSRTGSGASDVATTSLTCRRFHSLSRFLPALCFGPADVSHSHSSSSFRHSPAIQLEELVSRMVLKSQELEHLHVASAFAAPQSACPSCGGASCGGKCAHHCCCGCGCDAPQQQHPREFIFEAWMRHVGSHLKSLALSRALQSPAASHAAGDAATTVNVWENEDLSLHLRHVANYCTSLRSLSLGSLSLSSSLLSSPTSRLPPMRHLEHLSLSWIHASNESLQAILDAAPNLRRLSIFMATGSPRINLRLPATVEHVELAYLRAESCTLHNARSLHSISIRDMFIRAVQIHGAPDLRHVAIASASLLEIVAPESARISSLNLKAGSFCWTAMQTLVQASGSELTSLSLDFFSAGLGALTSSIFSLTWLAAMCPNLKALSFGALPWQLVVSWAVASGALQAAGAATSARWPQLEELKVKVQDQRPEALLLLHAVLLRMPNLQLLQVAASVEEEEEEEVEEEWEEEEEEEVVETGEEPMLIEGEEEEEEEEGDYITLHDEGDVEEGEEGEEGEDGERQGMEGDAMEEETEEDDAVPERFRQSVVIAHGGSALLRRTINTAYAERAEYHAKAASKQELFMKGLMCLQQRFSRVNLCLPVLYRSSSA